MTVDKIKDYIDKHTKGIYIHYDTIDFRRLYNAMLEIKSMLDQLDRPRYIMDDNGNINRLDNEWVSVDDKLPSNEEKVLTCVVFNNYKTILIMTFEDGVFYENIDGWSSGENTNRVIAWKPLPEPYERGE